MTAGAGECNGRSEGSEVEFEEKGGGDLKDNGVGGGGIACRGDGEEIGGSFVIVNGDSEDHSDRSDLDPATKSENGEAKEIVGKEEPLPFENEKNENFFGVRSNGDDVGEEKNVMGSGSDAKVGQEPDVLVAEPEKEPKSEEIEKEGNLVVDVEERVEVVGPSESGSDVEIEPKTEEVVEEAETKEKVEVLPSEEWEAEAEVVIAESHSKGELGSGVGKEDVMEPETAELVSASRVEEGQEPAPAGVAEVNDEGDGGVIDVAVDVAGETENAAKVESTVEAEPKEETHTAVEEAGSVAKLESAVEEEQKEEPTTEVEATEKLAEFGTAVEVEPEQQPCTVAEEMDNGEVEEGKEPKVEVEENGDPAEVEAAVEVNLEQESETVLDTADNIEADERKEHEYVVAENTSSGHPSFENGGAGIPSVDVDASIIEPSDHPVNGNADSIADINGDTLKDELNCEARNFPLEDTESTALSHVDEKELVEEITRSTDGERVVLEVSNGETILSESKTDVSSGDMEVNNGETILSESKTDVSNEDIEPRSLDPVTGVGLEPEDNDTEVELKDSVEDVKTIKDAAADRMKLVSESGSKSAESNECVDSSIEGDQSTYKDDDEEANHEQVQAAEMIQAPPETHVVEPSSVYMVKVPRPIDDELQKKIQDAQKIVEEKTKTRDEIGVKTREKAKVVYGRSLAYKAELAKERAARAIYRAKRQEFDEVQQKISRINNANSISDIDEKIRSMVHRQQHETISLKQEKQYIHDINQMKRLREQLSSKKASQEEIDEALKQADEIEASFNSLKKELDSEKAACISAENSTKSAWEVYKAEEESLKELKEEHNAADGVRQEAYSTLTKLRNEFAEKAKYFKMYKADQSSVTNYKFSRDSQGLRSHCNRQVEKMMDLWNNNAEFREQYVKSNMYNTLRRLETSDGRQLGPGEEAPILRSHADKSSNIIFAPSSNVQSPATVLSSEIRQGNLTEPSATKRNSRTNQSVKLKSTTKYAPAEGGMPTVSISEESGEKKENNKVKKEEEEMARKAEELARKEEEVRKAKAAKEEELRKEKADAELKEQLRLEQKAKAREAEERKRRKAEKAQAKAEYRARKETVLKEKKKAKKENKKSGAIDMPNGGPEGVSAPVSGTNLPETYREPETSGAVTRKRSTRPASSTRQYNKVQVPLPLPLRNRGKRKMTTWMWALLAVLLVLMLFIAGNYISFSTFGMPDFGF